MIVRPSWVTFADAAGGFNTSSYTQNRAEISAYIDAQQKLLTTQAAGYKA